MDDYDNYNTLGIVTRDTGDLDAVPPQIRITGRPQSIRTKKQWGGTPNVTDLSDEDVAAMRKEYAGGVSLDKIRKSWGVSKGRAQRIIEGGSAEPLLIFGGR